MPNLDRITALLGAAEKLRELPHLSNLLKIVMDELREMNEDNAPAPRALATSGVPTGGPVEVADPTHTVPPAPFVPDENPADQTAPIFPADSGVEQSPTELPFERRV